jgi:hypothetical protein
MDLGRSHKFFVQLWKRNSNYNINAVVGAMEPPFTVL